MRTIIIDDERLAREELKKLLKDYHEIEIIDEAKNPEEGIEKIKALKPDLIFLDIGLPEISGFDVCTKIRSTPGHDGIPILFLTGMTTIQNRAQSKLLGGNDFIGKPFHVLELGIKALLWVSKGRLAELAA